MTAPPSIQQHRCTIMLLPLPPYTSTLVCVYTKIFFHVLLYTTKFSNSVKFLASDRPQPTSSKLPLKNNQIKAVNPQSK